MVGYRWIAVSLVFMLCFTAAVTQSHNFIVRGGDQLTLPCGNYQGTCDQFEWLFVRQPEESAKRLISNGKTITYRMDVAENCALLISNVTAEDGGQYTCRLLDPLRDYTNFHLYVVTMREHKDNSCMQLSCSVSGQQCIHTVTWLYDGRRIIEDEDTDSRNEQNGCTVTTTVTLQKSNNLEPYRCEVSERSQPVKNFTFSRLSDKPDEDEESKTSTEDENSETSPKQPPGNADGEGWWRYIVVAAALTALITITVAVVVWKRRRGTETPKGNLKPVVTQVGQETSQDTADPEDGLSYASISFAKKSAEAQIKHDDEDDTVTYSTVKTTSSSGGAPDDLGTLYASINEPHT